MELDLDYIFNQYNFPYPRSYMQQLVSQNNKYKHNKSKAVQRYPQDTFDFHWNWTENPPKNVMLILRHF